MFLIEYAVCDSTLHLQKRLQHYRAEEVAQALGKTFITCVVDLERVEVFKYLGRIRNSPPRSIFHN